MDHCSIPGLGLLELGPNRHERAQGHVDIVAHAHIFESPKDTACSRSHPFNYTHGFLIPILSTRDDVRHTPTSLVESTVAQNKTFPSILICSSSMISPFPALSVVLIPLAVGPALHRVELPVLRTRVNGRSGAWIAYPG